MNYFDFRRDNIDRCCFSIYGASDISQSARSSNLTRWVKEGKLVKLRKGWYAFPERARDNADRMFIANNIYAPSYVSLFFALSYYEMIPESVSSITSITTLKTSEFTSEAGTFSYKSVKPSMFFGYDVKTASRQMPYMMASPEKALLDLIYLYPEYSSVSDAEELRLDEDFMKEEFNWSRIHEYLAVIGSRALASRIGIIEKVYR